MDKKVPAEMVSLTDGCPELLAVCLHHLNTKRRVKQAACSFLKDAIVGAARASLLKNLRDESAFLKRA